MSSSSTGHNKLAALRHCAANDLVTLLPRVCQLEDIYNFNPSYYRPRETIPNLSSVGFMQLIQFLTCPIPRRQHWQCTLFVQLDAQKDLERIFPLLRKLDIIIQPHLYIRTRARTFRDHYTLKRFSGPEMSFGTLALSLEVRPPGAKREWYRTETEEGPVRKRKRLDATFVCKSDRERIKQLPLEWDLAVSVKMRDIIIRLLSTRLPICKDIAKHIASFVHVSAHK